jgi:ribosome-associated protein
MSDEPPDASKSERKRQAQHLQELGRRVAELKRTEIEGLGFAPRLLDAIADYQRFASFGAKRRQLQFIGKLMRKVDTGPILELLDRRESHSAAARYELHQLEMWRDRLIAEPAALTEYLRDHPHADRQLLRQQLRKVQKAADEAQRKTAARSLFRLLRESSEFPARMDGN